MSRCVRPVVYVSGPVTGVCEGNRPTFALALGMPVMDVGGWIRRGYDKKGTK